MEKQEITVVIGIEKIKDALETAATEMFKSSYSNPVKELLEKSIKEKEGEIKTVVDEIIAAALSKPEFKEKISDAVISSLVQAALKNR